MLRKIFNLIKAEFNFAYVGGTDLISAGLGAAFWLYFASVAAISDYGEVAYLISISAIAFTFSSFGMSQVVLTFLPKGNQSILYEVNSLLLLSTVLAASVAGVLSDNLIVAIYVVSLMSYQMSTTELLATTRHKEYGIVSIGNKVVQIGLSLILYFVMGINGFILGYAISNLVFSYRFVLLLRKFTVKFVELQKVWKFSTHISLSTIASTMRFQWDKILIGALLGYLILGSYQFSFQFYTMLTILVSSIMRYLLPYESKGLLKKGFKLLSFVMMSLIVVMVMIVAPYAIPVFYPQYVQSITAIQLVSIAIIPGAIYNLISVKLMAQNKMTVHLLISTFVSNACYIILLFLLGPIFDVTGLATSLLIASTIQAIYMVLLVRGRIY